MLWMRLSFHWYNILFARHKTIIFYIKSWIFCMRWINLLFFCFINNDTHTHTHTFFNINDIICCGKLYILINNEYYGVLWTANNIIYSLKSFFSTHWSEWCLVWCNIWCIWSMGFEVITQIHHFSITSKIGKQ